MAIEWQIQGTAQRVGAELPDWLARGWLHPACPVSADGGRTWIPAAEAARRLHLRGSDELAMIMPTRESGWATGGQYLGLFSLLFFGGPACFLSAVLGWDPGPRHVVRLVFVLVAIALGPLPVAACAWLGRRDIQRDPTLRGTGRVLFAWVTAALMAIAAFAGLVGAIVR